MNLRAIRLKHGFTQEELALELGISRCALANLESGRKSLPAKHIPKMLEILDITKEELLGKPFQINYLR